MSDLKIYGVPLSRAYRALWMANELGLDYENVPIHFADGSAKTPDYLAVNPNGRIHRFFLPEDQRDSKLADEGEQQLQKPLSVLDQRLATTGYLVGPTFTVADLNVASVLSWARMGRVNLAGFPHVDQWLAGCLKRPAAVKARPKTMAN